MRLRKFVWYVTVDGVIISKPQVTRADARGCKRRLIAASKTKVKIVRRPILYGTLEYDLHS